MLDLRPALVTDVGFMTSLESEVLQAGAPASDRLPRREPPSAFDLSNSRILLWQCQPIGMVVVERAPDHLRLRKLYLSRPYRGRGIGRDVVAIIRDEARGAALPLRLSVPRPHWRALRFYLREQFAAVETTDERVLLQYVAAQIANSASDRVL